MYTRTVTYSIDADSLEAAEEVWAEDGPELGESRRVEVTETSVIRSND